MNGLSYHSRVPLEKLEVKPGSLILDVGCGWGDTAIEPSRRQALAPFEQEGKVVMGSSSWTITANKPVA